MATSVDPLVWNLELALELARDLADATLEAIDYEELAVEPSHLEETQYELRQRLDLVAVFGGIAAIRRRLTPHLAFSPPQPHERTLAGERQVCRHCHLALDSHDPDPPYACDELALRAAWGDR